MECATVALREMGVVVPSRAMAKPKPLPKTLLKKLRAALESERAEVAKQLEESEAAADVSQWRDAGFDDDAADTGTAEYERAQAQSLASHSRRLLSEIDVALRKMDEGKSYGMCERCGDPIERARLEAIPYATLCLTDKRRAETGR